MFGIGLVFVKPLLTFCHSEAGEITSSVYQPVKKTEHGGIVFIL